ncbi:hypothetical protein BY458DRAFT_304271 [Sporodiniella umbellata]|nr:hypothetical protein BY458DRAFT_304271 [Sporodiniella umbellata]
MPTSNIHSNATIINIQSPDDSPEIVQPSLNSQQPLAKPSPKVEEYKKMIQHIMGKILKRKRPSSSILHLQPVDQFDNDDTIDLLIKLRSALMVCHSVGLGSQVLMQRVRTPNATPVSSKVNSPLPSPRIGSPSRSPENIGSILPSAIQPKNDKRSEFEKILSVLSDLISNDSRYKTANPKPSVPPFIMQSVLIDIGLILIQMQEDAMSLYSIGLTYLPAFEAFSSGPMLGKLMSLYLDSLLPKIIRQKDALNDTKKTPEKTHLTVHQKQNTPTINIQSPDHSNALKMSHLTIDTQIPATDSNTNSPYTSNQTDPCYTSALFTPLLFFMIEYLDPYLSHPEKSQLDFTLTQQADSIHSFHRALGFMMLHKSDIYLDLLDIISHSTHAVKYRACQVLFSYYSTSTGHALITNSVSLLSTQEEIEALDKYRNEQEPVDLEEDHVWYPHLFESSATCKECFDTIEGFGLCCYPCKASIHYHCSQAANKEQSLLYYLKPGGIQRVVMPHFCSLRPEPRFKDGVHLGHTDWTATSNSAHVPWGDHLFDLVNLYTIANCTHCRLPLCGVSQQAYHCSLCHRFIHPQCLAEKRDKWACRPGDFLTEEELKVTSASLTKSLGDFYKDAIPFKPQDLQGRGFEEVSTMLSVLLIQDNIIYYGVTAGSIMISDSEEVTSAHPYDTGSFYLVSQSIKVCIDYLSQCRAFFSSYKPFQCLLSQEDYLGHLGAMMKSLKTTLFGNSSPTGYMSPGLDTRRSVGDSRGFLQVNPAPYLSWEDEEESFDEHVHEQLDRSLLLSWMMTNMGFKSRKATEMLLQHMRNLGLFERADGSPIVFSADESHLATQEENQPIACLFPIPFAAHNSFTVESTINAIEACLSDVDLSINECGFLLLVRRCWPNNLTSNYSRERLIRAILQWVFDEDERLLALHAELMSNKSTQQKQTKWAQTAFARKTKGQARQSVMFQTAGVSSGASSIYVGTRHALKRQYISLWMAAVHDMDEQVYSEMLYTAIEDILDSKNELCVVPEWNESFDQKKHTTQKYERFVSFILKLKSYDLVFSVLDFLIQRWFNEAYEDFDRLGFLKDNEPAEIKHLAKLCSTKLNIHQTHEPGSAIDILLAQITDGSKDGIDRGMRWLELVVYAGAGVPSKTLVEIATLMTTANASLDMIAKFTKIIWFQIMNVLNAPLAQKDIIEMLGILHKNTLDDMYSHLDTNTYHVHEYLKQSIAILAYVFGCSLEQISKLDILPVISHRQTNIPTNKRNTLHAKNANTVQPDVSLPIFDCMLKQGSAIMEMYGPAYTSFVGKSCACL